MKLANYFFLIVVLVLTFACNYIGQEGSGVKAEEERQIAEFSKINVSGAFTVNVTVGESTRLKIIADDNLIKYIITKVEGETLIIDSEKNLSPKGKIKVIISVSELYSISSSGANNIDVKGINSNQFDVDISGACNVELEGKTEDLTIDMSGATKLYSEQLLAQNVKLDLSGATKAVVFASSSLEADVSGVGNVEYLGDPPNVKSDVSGVASVKKR